LGAPRSAYRRTQRGDDALNSLRRKSEGTRRDAVELSFYNDRGAHAVPCGGGLDHRAEQPALVRVGPDMLIGD
jgi:hypothetical protein